MSGFDTIGDLMSIWKAVSKMLGLQSLTLEEFAWLEPEDVSRYLIELDIELKALSLIRRLHANAKAALAKVTVTATVNVMPSASSLTSTALSTSVQTNVNQPVSRGTVTLPTPALNLQPYPIHATPVIVSAKMLDGTVVSPDKIRVWVTSSAIPNPHMDIAYGSSASANQTQKDVILLGRGELSVSNKIFARVNDTDLQELPYRATDWCIHDEGGFIWKVTVPSQVNLIMAHTKLDRDTAGIVLEYLPAFVDEAIGRQIKLLTWQWQETKAENQVVRLQQQQTLWGHFSSQYEPGLVVSLSITPHCWTSSSVFGPVSVVDHGVSLLRSLIHRCIEVNFIAKDGSIMPLDETAYEIILRPLEPTDSIVGMKHTSEVNVRKYFSYDDDDKYVLRRSHWLTSHPTDTTSRQSCDESSLSPVTLLSPSRIHFAHESSAWPIGVVMDIRVVGPAQFGSLTASLTNSPHANDTNALNRGIRYSQPTQWWKVLGRKGEYNAMDSPFVMRYRDAKPDIDEFVECFSPSGRRVFLSFGVRDHKTNKLEMLIISE